MATTKKTKSTKSKTKTRKSSKIQVSLTKKQVDALVDVIWEDVNFDMDNLMWGFTNVKEAKAWTDKFLKTDDVVLLEQLAPKIHKKLMTELKDCIEAVKADEEHYKTMEESDCD